jgi:hypothetical protein
MVTRTYRDALFVQRRTDLVLVVPGEHERQDTALWSAVPTSRSPGMPASRDEA